MPNERWVLLVNRLGALSGLAQDSTTSVMPDKHVDDLTETRRCGIISSVGRCKFLFRGSGAR